MPKCYVGERKYCPANIKILNTDAHPRDFEKVVADLTEDIWTNNPYIVDCFKAENVVVCRPQGFLILSDHPKWEIWKDLIHAGEFWSIFGEK